MEHNADYTRIWVTIYADNYQRETEKARFYKLWGRKPQWIPKSITENFQTTDREHRMTLPLWFVRDNNLKSLVDDDQKDLFPAKTKVKEVAPLLVGMSPEPEEIPKVQKEIEERFENWF